MNVAAAMTDLQAARLAGEIQAAVASRVLTTANQQGANVIQLLDAAVDGFEASLARANAGLDPSRVLDVFA